MTDASGPFVAELRPFPFNFAPRGWAQCDGQLLPISQNTALFSLLGTTYGGNGQTTFALPDLRGRLPLHQGQGPGLSLRSRGENGGAETVTLQTGEIASHQHAVAATGTFTTKNPGGDVPAPAPAPATDPKMYGDTPNTPMHASTIQPAGGGVPHDNLAPYLGLNWCIALQGIFPPRGASQ